MLASSVCVTLTYKRPENQEQIDHIQLIILLTRIFLLISVPISMTVVLLNKIIYKRASFRAPLLTTRQKDEVESRDWRRWPNSDKIISFDISEKQNIF